MKKFEKGLFLVLLIYCLVRLPLILSLLHGNYEDWFANYLGEKYRGAVAVALLENLEIPLLQYVDESYGIGALVNGILTLPFFALLGKTLFALKLVPFCWYFLSLVAWYFVFKKHFSPTQTFFILLFLVFPPPQVTEFMSYNIGFHFESILWIALSLLIFRRLLEGTLSPKKAGIYLGLIGGFSSAIILTNLLTVAVLWIYLILIRDTKIKKLNFSLFYIPAFLVGFSPLIFYNSMVGWSGFEYLWHQVLKPNVDLSGLINNLFWTLRHSLQAFLNYFRGFAFLYLLSLFYLIWKKGKSFWPLKGGLDIKVFAILFQVILLGLFVHKGKTVNIQYLFPLVPFVGMTLVCAIMVLEKRLKMVVGVSLILIGMAQNIALINFHSLGVSLTIPGYYFETFLDRVPLGNNFPLFWRNFKKLVEGSHLSNKKGLYQDVPSDYFKIENEGKFREILSFIEGEDAEIKLILFEKMGISLGSDLKWNTDQLDPLLKQWNVPLDYLPALYRGIAQGVTSLEIPLEEKIQHATSFCATIAAFKKNCYEGIGLWNTEFGERLARHNWIVSQLETNFIPDYLRGLGERAFYENHPHLHPLKPFINDLEDSQRLWFLEGLAIGISKEEDVYQQSQMREYLKELSL